MPDQELLERLDEMSRELTRKETEKAQAEGRISQLMEQLEKEFDCSSIDKAEKELQSMEKRRTRLQKELEASVQKLEDNYSWSD